MPRTATITLDTSQLTERARSATVTIRFDQPTPGLSLDSLAADHATLTGLRSADGGLTWTATLTVHESVQNGSNHVTLRYPDLVDDQGQGVLSVSSASYAIDTSGPWLQSATVNGRQLVLRYAEGADLNAAHKPANSAFLVFEQEFWDPVTDVRVDAAANTITLTLTNAVTSEAEVTVDYRDPSGWGDQVNTVQDMAGNHARGVYCKVTNLSPPDRQAPTLAPDGITLDRYSVAYNSSASVTFTFSEPVRGFDAGDVNLPAGCQLRA